MVMISEKEQTEKERQIVWTLRKMTFGKLTVSVENSQPVRIIEEKSSKL